MEQNTVVIAGAGPVGLTLAVALADQGIGVTVLEAEPDLTLDLRAGTFHPPTVEMLAPYGIAQQMLDGGIPIHKWQIRDRAQGVIAEWDLGLLAGETPYPFRLHIEQHKLARMLAAKLAVYPHAALHFGVEACAIEQDGAGVTVGARRGNETVAYRCQWMVGADGGRSFTRKAIDSEFEGFTWPERFVVASTDYDLGQHGYAGNAYISDPVEFVALFRVPHDGPPGLWRIVFPVPPDETDETALSDARVQQRLRGFMPWRERYDVAYRSMYRVHQRVAKAWRRERVLLAGDAAHVNNPLGAFGMNGGIHDAINLAAKLGQVLRDEADAALLDRYVRQRRTVNIEFIQANSIRNKHTLEERDPAVREQRFAELRARAADPVQAREFLRVSSMIASVERAAQIE